MKNYSRFDQKNEGSVEKHCMHVGSSVIEQLITLFDKKLSLGTLLSGLLVGCGSGGTGTIPPSNKIEYSAILMQSPIRATNTDLNIDENTTYVMGIVRDGFVAGNNQFSVTNVQNGETLPDNFCQKSPSGTPIGIGKINVSSAPSLPGNKNFPTEFATDYILNNKKILAGGERVQISTSNNIVAYAPTTSLSNENRILINEVVDIFEKSLNLVYTASGGMTSLTHPSYNYGGVALVFYEDKNGYMSTAGNVIYLDMATLKNFISSNKADIIHDAVHELNHAIGFGRVSEIKIPTRSGGILSVGRGIFAEGGAEAGASITQDASIPYDTISNEDIPSYLKNINSTGLNKDFKYNDNSYGGAAMLNLVIQDYYNKTMFPGKSLLSGYQHLARKAHDKKENFFVDIKNETGKDMQDRVEEMGKVLLTDGKDCVVNGIDTPLFDVTALTNGAVKLQQLTNGNTNSPAELGLYKLPFSASPTKVTLSLPEGVTAVLMKVERKKVETK